MDSTTYYMQSIGGNGTASSITGTSVTYAGGGGGSQAEATTSAGGTGGGGTGASQNGNPTAGTANLGGGGGGVWDASSTAGSGGSGVVILKYVDTLNITVSGLTNSTSTSGGYKVTTLQSGTGTVSFS
jgi:hypothetical protein